MIKDLMFKTNMFIQNHHLVHIIIKICNKDEIMTFADIQKLHSKYPDIQRCQKPWKWGGGCHSCGDFTITGEWLQILTNTRHSDPFSSDGSIACHTYCDIENPFKLTVIPEDPWHSHLLPSVWQWSCHYVY